VVSTTPYPNYPPPATAEKYIYAYIRELNELSKTEDVWAAQVGDSISNYGADDKNAVDDKGKPTPYAASALDYGFPARMQQSLQEWAGSTFYGSDIAYQYYSSKFAFNVPDAIGASLQRGSGVPAVEGAIGLGLQGSGQGAGSDRYKVRRGTGADIYYFVDKIVTGGNSVQFLVDGAVIGSQVPNLGWNVGRVRNLAKAKAHDVRVKFAKGSAKLSGIGFYEGTENKGWKFIDASRSGIATWQYTSKYGNSKAAWTGQFPYMSFDGKAGPDIILLTTSTNDWNSDPLVYGAWKRNLAEDIRKVAPYAIIIFANPWRPYFEGANDDTWARYEHQDRLIAADMERTIVMPFSKFIPQGGIEAGGDYMYDGLHCTSLGYERMMKVMMNYLKGNYFTGTIPAKSGMTRVGTPTSPGNGDGGGETPVVGPTLTNVSPASGATVTGDVPFRVNAPGANNVYAVRSNGTIIENAKRESTTSDYWGFTKSYLDLQGVSQFGWVGSNAAGGVTKTGMVNITVAAPPASDSAPPIISNPSPAANSVLSGVTPFRVKVTTESSRGVAGVALSQGGLNLGKMLPIGGDTYELSVDVNNPEYFSQDATSYRIDVVNTNGTTATLIVPVTVKRPVVTGPPDVYLLAPGNNDVVEDFFVAEISATYVRGMSHANLYSDDIYLGPTELDTDGIYRGAFDIAGLPAGVVKDGTIRLKARAVNKDGIAGESSTITVKLYKPPTPGVPVRIDDTGFATEKDLADIRREIAAIPTNPGEGGTAGVSSVNTRSGAVTLTKSDVDLANVDNTSDKNKPVSDAVAAILADKISYAQAQTALDLKADATALASGLGTKVNSSTYTAGMAAKADLVGGFIPTSQIPAISTFEYYFVANQAAMLALTTAQVQRGDVAVLMDGKGSYIYTGTNPSQIGSWSRQDIATDRPTSVNGQVGVVVLGRGDIGLPNVDNTSDLSKPISTATQAALDVKAALVHTHAASDITGQFLPAQLGLTATGTVPYRSGANGGILAAIAFNTANSLNTLVQRDGSGNFHVITPTAVTHPANKAYVDSAIATTARVVLLDPGVTVAPSSVLPGSLVLFR
jgi:hypothetical protein